MEQGDEADVMTSLTSTRTDVTDVTDPDGDTESDSEDDDPTRPSCRSRCCVLLGFFALCGGIGLVSLSAWQLKPLRTSLQNIVKEGELSSEATCPTIFILALLLPMFALFISCCALAVCRRMGGQATSVAFLSLGFSLVAIAASGILYYQAPLQNQFGPKLVDVEDVEAYKFFALMVMLLGDAGLVVAWGANCMRPRVQLIRENTRALTLSSPKFAAPAYVQIEASDLEEAAVRVAPMAAPAIAPLIATPVIAPAVASLAAPMAKLPVPMAPLSAPNAAMQAEPQAQDLDRRFQIAVKLATQRITKESASQEKRLLVYGLYKQATEGDSNEFQPVGKLPGSATWQRYEAWARHRGMNKRDAMLQYSMLIERGA